ncbi:MAG TPA: tRNA (adenosine(37)-N6)-threonylcarbamoyltransferase complex transferase subunit TsaD [Candidatus Dojkabacteria bacterium]|nr:tRNA (adenosine(37)-N6)-threonylcarbamoyltransferase complex transferase subunit TsaD [Candidatus Dojkabacteria bacterium]
MKAIKKETKFEPIIIGIDTSCDETSIAVSKGRKILSNIRTTQIDLHKKFGGVVPDISRRAHEENIEGVYREALRKAKIEENDIEYIAVTYGPGLAIDLEVGINFAKELAIKLNKPFVPVNHMEGHLTSALALNSKGNGDVLDVVLDNMFPALALLMSGKHTEIVYVKNIGDYKKLGQTLDDAAGEAFDKVGRMLNFGYPGGPIVSEFAKRGELGKISLPIPMEKSNDLNFSYSGLKTACLYKIKELRESNIPEKEWIYDFCRSFVESITRSVEIKLLKALEQNSDIKSVLVGGGVFSSEFILRRVLKLVNDYGLDMFYPTKEIRSDNGAMICIAGYFNIIRNNYLTDIKQIQVLERNPRLSL